MSPWALAFFIGLFGSVHCIGMCGPLAFAIPSNHNDRRWLLLADKVAYQLGRVVSYTLLGLATGFLGKQLWLSGLQQFISIISGLLIIGVAFSRFFKFSALGGGGVIFKPFTKLLGYALRHKANHFITGVLNGFLPCGFVYLALAGAINTGNAGQAAGYMFYFGLGTMPLMIMASFSMGMITPMVRRKINKAIPYFMLCLGIWFVLKGLTLDIPYLSPAKGIESHQCK